MNLNPENLLSSLAKLKEAINAPDIIWSPRPVDLLKENISIYEISESLTNSPGKLIVFHSGRVIDYVEQRLLYIPKTNSRFHFMECETIQRIRQQGRGERFILTNRTTGKFKVEDSYFDQELKVCRCCLKAWNYKGYNNVSRELQNKIVNDFNVKEFFENCRPIFHSLPLRNDHTLLKNEYDRNWSSISTAYRACKGWCCEKCGVDLSDRHKFLHTHHKSSVKYDVRPENLIALCVLCHYHYHMSMQKAPYFDEAKAFIERRRREMGI